MIALKSQYIDYTRLCGFGYWKRLCVHKGVRKGEKKEGVQIYNSYKSADREEERKEIESGAR